MKVHQTKHQDLVLVASAAMLMTTFTDASSGS
jgi:hypothetical protein